MAMWKTGWGIAAGPADSNQERKAVFQTKEPVGLKTARSLSSRCFQKTGQRKYAGTFSAFRDDQRKSQS